MGLNIEEQKAVEQFKKDVVDPSMHSLVILDFWAEWCGPCKQLTPTLEKVGADYADKGVVLAKVNVDEQQFIASQFQVKSIPTVYAMFQGQPVADLTQSRTETQLKQMLDQILEQIPLDPSKSGAGAQGGPGKGAQDVAPLIEMGDQILAEGDGERALGIFAQIVEMKSDDKAAQAGLVRALVATGQLEQAEQALASLPDDVSSDPAFEQAHAALALAKDTPDDGETAALRDAAAANPQDMDAQFAWANAAFAKGDRDAAADTLLKMIETDPEWNEGAAKAKLLQIFEAVGLEDPWVSATRRRLSLLLFG